MTERNDAVGRMARSTSDFYGKIVDETIARQERNTRFARRMVEELAEEARHQTEGTSRVAWELVELAEWQLEAFQAMVRQSTDAYADFLRHTNFLFGASACSGRRAPAGGQGAPPEGEGNGGTSIEGYDGLSVEEVSDRIGDLSAEEVRAVRSYEGRHKRRETLIERLDRALV